MKYLSILCLTFIFAAPLMAECSAADKQALVDFDHAWGKATTSGDRAALQNIYASDYMGTAPGAEDDRTTTIDNAVKNFENQKGQPQPAIAYDNYIVSCSPMTATITHRNTITTTEDGKNNTMYTRSVHFLEKRNGKWQVVGNAGGPLSDAQQVAYLEEDWNDADMRKDASWFETHYAGNMTAISGRTGKITNKQQEIADMQSRKDTPTWEEITDLNTRKEGDTVVVTGINHVKGNDATGKPFDRRTAYTDTWVKRDGKWMVLATQGTDIK